MSNRWAPDGNGWIRVIDYGDNVVWVRPDGDGVTITVYAGDGFGHLLEEQRAEVWTVRVGRGSDLLDTIRDKIHRVRWVQHVGEGDPSGIVPALCSEFRVLSWERVEVPQSHHGHPRLNFNRYVWMDPMPRKIRDALRP